MLKLNLKAQPFEPKKKLLKLEFEEDSCFEINSYYSYFNFSILYW